MAAQELARRPHRATVHAGSVRHTNGRGRPPGARTRGMVRFGGIEGRERTATDATTGTATTEMAVLEAELETVAGTVATVVAMKVAAAA